MPLVRVIARVISMVERQWLGPGLELRNSFSFNGLQFVDLIKSFVSAILCFCDIAFIFDHCPRVITPVV